MLVSIDEIKFDHVERSWKPIVNSFFDREKTVGDGELSQKVAFPAHFDIIYTSSRDYQGKRVNPPYRSSN